MIRNKRLALVAAVVALTAGYFWTQSRVPALNEKAEMGDELQLDDPLAFDVEYVVERSDPLPTRVAFTTLNWAYTNRKGMVFGVLFGAALMSLFSLLARRSYQSSFLNSGLGILIGAPLGVCVNCATPIGQSIYSAGARLETALATMLSSPTLNVIVLTMLFSLFPPYFVAIKLFLTVGFLLVGIPLVVRYYADQSRLTVPADACPVDLAAIPCAEEEGWGQAAAWTAKSLLSNLWWVVKRTVPLMIVAGFLGSLAIHLLPWDTVVNLFEDRGGRLYKLIGELGVAVVGLGIVATLGAILPVPMTFDIIIVATLLAAGMPVHYAMALLFTLGIFSVYPFTILWREVSRNVAVAVGAAITVLGVVGGLAALAYDRFDRERATQLFLEAFRDSEPAAPELAPAKADLPAAELRASLAKSAPRVEPAFFAGGLEVERIPFGARAGEAGSLFRKSEGTRYGLEEPYRFGLERFMRPYEYHLSVAAGDVHGDGLADVVLPAEGGGLSLYANAGGRFVRQQVELPSLAGAFVGQAALVDLDGDGWLDLFVSTYRRGNFAVYNDRGEFREDRLERLPNLDDDKNLTATAAFGDLDRDGDLEIVLGNWARWQGRAEARNALLSREGGGYALRVLDQEIVGETLATLFTDWNDDGELDLIIGNEGQPNAFYLGDGEGGLELVDRRSGTIPHTPKTTMTIASSDLDNDLAPEIYLGQITGRSTQRKHIPTVEPEELCDTLDDEATRERCRADTAAYQLVRRSFKARDGRRCLELEDARRRDTCLAYHTLGSAQWTKDERFCAYFPERWADLRVQCHAFFRERVRYTNQELERALPQIKADNVLLVRDGEGGFVDRATPMGLATAGWTWNAKFADLNHDEWLDLFVVNGIFETKTRESKLLFLNREGKEFVDATHESGVEDYFPTSAYSYLDLENDGDLDVVAAPVHGPLWVYENRSIAGNAVAFELRDFRGNRHGIGSKVVIHYGEGESRHQMREIQSGGGFISFDPAVAHFGLGRHDRVARVEIRWSTGERSELRGDFRAGATYRLTRRGPETRSAALREGERGF